MFFTRHRKLGPDETEIIGEWILVKGKVKADKNCERIKYLIRKNLVKKAVSKQSGGWETLYQDPGDLRYWELTFPKSSWHGGGPPALINLSEEDAKKKYDFDGSGKR